MCWHETLDPHPCADGALDWVRRANKIASGIVNAPHGERHPWLAPCFLQRKSERTRCFCYFRVRKASKSSNFLLKPGRPNSKRNPAAKSRTRDRERS